MKKRLFLLGLLSFMYVGAQVLDPVSPVMKTVKDILSTEKHVVSSAAEPIDPPVNDDCSGAIALTVNADNLCTNVTAGTLNLATDSGVPVGDPSNGEAKHDVWFSFVATATSQMITVSNVQGDFVDLFHQVLDGNCNNLFVINSSDPNVSITNNLEIGHTYFVRVYSIYGQESPATFDICVGIPTPSPVNDECTGAIELTANPDFNCGTVTHGSLYFATDSGILNPGNGSPDDDVWYSFVATSSIQRVTLLNVQGNAPSGLVLQAFSGDCDALTGIVAPYTGTNNLVLQGLDVDATYYLRVYNSGQNNFEDISFDICLGTPPAPPANNDCDGAIALTVNPVGSCAELTEGTIMGASESGVPAPTGTFADDDVWYSFVATSDRHKLSLLDLDGSAEYGMVIEVLDGNCNDGFGDIGYSVYSSDLIVSDLAIGTTYFVRVYSGTADAAQTTSFKLCLSVAPPAPANDDCGTAVALTVNPIGSSDAFVHGTLDQATDSGETPNPGEGAATNDVWYSFVATSETHTVSLTNVEGSNTYPAINVLEGECGGGFSSIAFDSNNKFINMTGLTVGNTYYVRIYSFYEAADNTTFDISVSVSPEVPENDDCTNAKVLTVDAGYCTGSNTNGDTTSASPSASYGSPECFGSGNHDLWFSFTVPANITNVNVSTNFGGGTLSSSQVALYSGSCEANLELIGCSQHANGSNHGFIENAPVNADETYLVRVSNYSEEYAGSFCVEVTTGSLSTGDFDKAVLKAYPNPVKDILTLSNTKDITNVAVYNLLGQQVMTKAVIANESQIDMSKLSAGTYMVKVTADNQVKTIKVIKE